MLSIVVFAHFRFRLIAVATHNPSPLSVLVGALGICISRDAAIYNCCVAIQQKLEQFFVKDKMGQYFELMGEDRSMA